MTDKEWYAEVSTLVLEGIELLNKGEFVFGNQVKIENFVRKQETPNRTKARKIRRIKVQISNALKCVGYFGGGVLLIVSAICWLVCACEGTGFGVPIVLMFLAAILGALGLVAQIYEDLLEEY